MNVKPKRWWGEERLRTVPATGAFVLECEVISPPSSRGKTVYLILDTEETTLLLKDLRDQAIADRSVPMS